MVLRRQTLSEFTQSHVVELVIQLYISKAMDCHVGGIEGVAEKVVGVVGVDVLDVVDVVGVVAVVVRAVDWKDSEHHNRQTSSSANGFLERGWHLVA